MENFDYAPETDEFDESFETDQEPTLATEMMKSFAISAAATAGSFAGIVAFGYGMERWQARKDRRAAAKEELENALTETDVTIVNE